MMKLNVNQLNLNTLNYFGWEWVHWLVLITVLFISVNEVNDRQQKRLIKAKTSQIKIIDEDIHEYQTMAERLGTMEVLPPVKDQWDYVVAIASKYGVAMSYQANLDKYKGPLEAWGGKVQGDTGPVLVVAKEIQETVPTFLYDFQLNGSTTTFEFSVLGSE